MGNPVTWFEISSKNAKSLQEFYRKAFGWQFQVLDGSQYALVNTGAKTGISGGIGEAEGPNQVIFYIEVADPNAALRRVEDLGGKTVVPVTEIPGLVTFAQFADPQGNVIGIFKGGS